MDLLERCRGDVELQRLVVNACRRDVVLFARDWVWLYEPRHASLGLPTSIPCDPWPVQEELLRWMDARLAARESGLVEKSRDMGWSWFLMIWMVHKWLFDDGFSGMVTSRKAQYVDTLGNINALLPKARYIIDWLPPWMRPRVPGVGRWSSKSKECTKLNALHHPRGGLLMGEVGGDSGRAGRMGAVGVDEAAALEHAEMIDAALSQTTDVVLYGSSARGAGNLFYKKRMSGDIPVFRMHWTADPRKDQAWYDEQRVRFRETPWIVPQEIDIDYTAGVEGVCIPGEWLRAAQQWQPSERVLLASPVAGYDPSDGGGDAHALVLRAGPALYPTPRWWEGTASSGAGETDRRLREWVAPVSGAACSTVVFDGVGIGTAVAAYFDAVPLYDALDFRAGASAGDEDWSGREASELFINAKALVWWRMRRRAQKTYEVATGQADHPEDELLWLPPDASELLTQLSTPRFFLTSAGKIRIESKEELSKRGVRSPDLADAAVMTLGEDIARSGRAAEGIPELHDQLLRRLLGGHT